MKLSQPSLRKKGKTGKKGGGREEMGRKVLHMGPMARRAEVDVSRGLRVPSCSNSFSQIHTKFKVSVTCQALPKKAQSMKLFTGREALGEGGEPLAPHMCELIGA